MTDDINPTADLAAYPVWRQAVRDFLAEGFKSGDILSHAWLEQRFGLDPVNDDSKLTALAFRERQFRWLSCIEGFKSELLKQHRVCLASVFGQGYRVTPPAEQSELATDAFEGEVTRAYRKAALRLKFIRIEELTNEQRRENADAVARLSMLRGMHKNALE